MNKNEIITETFVEENGDIVTHIRYVSSSTSAEKIVMLKEQIKQIMDELEILEG